jgi:D-xylose transport system permease protein
VLYAARLGSINPDGLSGFELTALAAAILGRHLAVRWARQRAEVLIGALILVTLKNGFNVLNLGANWQGLIEAWSSSSRPACTPCRCATSRPQDPRGRRPDARPTVTATTTDRPVPASSGTADQRGS